MRPAQRSHWGEKIADDGLDSRVRRPVRSTQLWNSRFTCRDRLHQRAPRGRQRGTGPGSSRLTSPFVAVCLPRGNERQSTFLADVWSSSLSMPLVRGSWAAFDGIADWIGAHMGKGLEGVGALGPGFDGMRKCFERGCWMISGSF